MYKDLIEEIKRILGDRYDEVKDFYRNVISSLCKIKVLVTRRSYVLYKIFRLILQEEANAQGSLLTEYGTIYNTHSLPIISLSRNHKTDEKILIIDDIIVNGKTIMGIIGQLRLDDWDEHNISVWCLWCNTEGLCENEVEPYLKHATFVMPFEWKILSDLLTNVIKISTIGYVSFVDSYRITNCSNTKSLQMLLQDCVEKIKENTGKAPLLKEGLVDSDITSHIIFWKQLLDEKVVSKYGLNLCIRFYEGKLSRTWLAIPYVIMPEIDACSCFKYLSSLLSELSISYPETFKINCLSQEQKISRAWSVLFYKWTIRAISEQIFKSFSEQMNISYEVMLECKESYDVIENPTLIEGEKVEDPLTFVLSLNNDSVKRSLNLFKDALVPFDGRKESFKRAFAEYLLVLRDEDDKRVVEGRERTRGLQISDILSLTTEISPEEILAVLISSWDEGKSAYTVECIEKDSQAAISGLIRHGEQGYKDYYWENRDVCEFFLLFFQLTQETRHSQLQRFANYFDYKYSTTVFNNFASHCGKHYLSDMMSLTLKRFTNSIDIDPEAAVENYVNSCYQF